MKTTLVLLSLTAGIFTSCPSASTAQAAEGSARRSCIDRFSDQVPQATEWALMPLETVVPRSVRDTIGALDAALRDEAQKSPQASIDAYRWGISICQTLRSAVNERDALLQRNQQLNNGGKVSEAWSKAWFEKTWTIGPSIEKSYASFRDAVRQSPPPKAPASEDRSLAFAFPALPPPPSSEPGGPHRDRRDQRGVSSSRPEMDAMPPQVGPGAAPRIGPNPPNLDPSVTPPGAGNSMPETAKTRAKAIGSKLEMSNGGLSRGAYDQHRVWSSRYGTRYYWANGAEIDPRTGAPSASRNVP